MEAIIILTTTSSLKNAEKISNELINSKLAACATIIPNVKSIFFWKEKVARANEYLIIIKTRKELFEKAKNKIKKLHPYEVPEIISIQIAAGSKQYLKWIEESTEFSENG
jgi:periplasmic divalent cation tolerance protein